MAEEAHQSVGSTDRWFVSIWLVTLASVPVSLRWTEMPGKAVVAVPLEILVAVCGLILGIWLFRGARPDRRLLFHPISLAIAAGLLWTLLTSITSIDPIVSLKYSIARIAYVLAFFAGGVVVFSRSNSATDRVVSAGLAGLLPVVAWTLWHHAPSGFSLRESIEVGKPFFSNHLEYGATLTFWILVLVGLAMAHRVRSGGFGGAAGWLAVGLLPAMWAGHSRSAWLALITGLAVIVLCRSGVGVRGVTVVSSITLVAFFAAFAIYYFDSPSLNADRRKSRLIEDHSINERLNRWSCAVRMAESRPLVGFGPGTYERSYAVFQHHDEMTSHSSLRGKRGDAHSEFFTALAEQGVIGLLMVVMIFAAALRAGVRASISGGTETQRWLALGWTAGIVALGVGSLFNSFFEVDRVAPLMWLACAVIVVMDGGRETTRPGNH